MVDFKKMDDKDFVFVNRPLSDKEDKAFSDFLKSRKAKPKQTREPKNHTSNSRIINSSLAQVDPTDKE